MPPPESDGLAPPVQDESVSARPTIDPSTPRLVVVGNFDGVHRGHQAVLRSAAAEARRRHLEPLVLTFDPHPAEVLGRETRAVLTRTERKVRLLEAVVPGLIVYVKRFDNALAAQSPREFAARILRDELCARATVVGENFRFGRGRAGDLSVLEALGKELGFEAWAESLHGDAEGPYSSTRIRALLSTGDVRGAAAMLSRPHLLSGVVTRGDERGRTLGFPTANLSEVKQALPKEGVYAVRVYEFSDGRALHLSPGVANLGARPTVDRPLSLEVHLLDYQADLYQKQLGITLLEHIRDIEKFPDIEALRTQIQKDVALARELTKEFPSAPPLPP